MGFGQHSILWLSAILTFYLMLKIFDLTRKQLDSYVGGGMDKLYNQVVKSDAPKMANLIKDNAKKLGTAFGWIKKK